MKIEPTKEYILELRKEIILDLHKKGYNFEVIGQIMNLERSWVSRIAGSSKRKKVSEQ